MHPILTIIQIAVAYVFCLYLIYAGLCMTFSVRKPITYTNVSSTLHTEYTGERFAGACIAFVGFIALYAVYKMG